MSATSADDIYGLIGNEDGGIRYIYHIITGNFPQNLRGLNTKTLGACEVVDKRFTLSDSLKLSLD